MRNRSLILLLTVLVASAFAAGCGSLRSVSKGDSDKIGALQGNIAKAIQMDAKACAPKELAYAEADLDQVRLEATQSWEAVTPEMGKAEKSVDTLMKKIQECEDKKKLPLCGLVAEPDTVAPGKCATLKWKGENVNLVYFGEEDPKKTAGEALAGSKEVCPKETTDYNMVCKGKYSTNYETATVKVEAPAPPPPPAPVVAPPPPPAAAPKVLDKMALRINFDTNKAVIRKGDAAEMKKAVDFLKKYPDSKIRVVGYTDSRGSAKLNQKLSEQRADAVKKYLIANAGVKADQITSEGKGPADPVGDNKTKAGQAMNRRVEVQILEK